MIKELNHVGLLTPDIAASTKLYTETLGGVIIRDHKDAQGSLLFMYVQLALGVVELIRAPKDAGNTGFAHVAFLIDNSKTLEENYAYLVNKGYKFTVEPKSTAAGDGRLAFFIDHSGVSFELIQRDENVRIRDLKNPYLESFHHITINVSENTIKDCDDFYTGDLGLAKSGSLYSIGADTIQLIETEDSAALKKPLSHISFHVKNCNETAEYLKSNAVQCSDIVTCGEFHSFEMQGPSGERIVFIGE